MGTETRSGEATKGLGRPTEEAPSAGNGAGRLVAVVVTHNRCAQLDTTLTRLAAEPKNLLHAVVVVDNQSTDDTEKLLTRHGAALPDRLLIHRSDTNLGGAGGFALGIRLAVERFDPDWVVVMDDDARPASGALDAFHAGDHAGWEAVAAAVYFPGGDICEMNRPSCNPFWSGAGMARLVRHVAMGRGRDGFHIPVAAYRDTEPTPIDGASFVGLFLSRRAIALAGYPDARLFIYGDDVLYTLGLRERGGRICFHPQVRFEHDFSTIHTAEKRFLPLWKSYYHHRNLLIVYRRAAGMLFWPALLLILPKWILKVRYHAGDRRAYLRLLARAVRDGLTLRLDVALADIQAAAR
ncbi:glycosyltransferase [Defluviimonas sp. SAOS-178_SWC]|uniref:glycosyltransferase n=1 Tax=Defluviimonas sp. SAOS-178_SWC TaxID=3121287 RepID=UPI003221F4ED